MTAIIAGGTLSCGCSAAVPSANQAMTANKPNDSIAANWDSYSYDGWSSFYLPATIVSTPPSAISDISAHRSLHVLRDDRDYVRSGYTDPRWVRMGESNSEIFLEEQQVLELPRRLDTGDAAPPATNDSYDNSLESDGGLHADLKAAAFMP